MFDYSDPELFWLNVTNALLGLVTIACLVAVGYAVGKELVMRFVARHAAAPAVDDHALVVTDLGITMADGGKPVDQGNVVVSEQGITRPSAPETKS